MSSKVSRKGIDFKDPTPLLQQASLLDQTGIHHRPQGAKENNLTGLREKLLLEKLELEPKEKTPGANGGIIRKNLNNINEYKYNALIAVNQFEKPKPIDADLESFSPPLNQPVPSTFKRIDSLISPLMERIREQIYG